MADQLKIAKSLMKKFKDYYDEETDSLRPDAPEEAKKAFERFNYIMDNMDIEIPNPGYPDPKKTTKK